MPLTKEETKKILNEKFNNAVEIKLEQHIYDICEKFAYEVNPTTKYADCGQNDMNKRLTDNIIGKVGEFAAYTELCALGKEYGFITTPPDTKIYKGRQKSWRADMLINCADGYLCVAVKAQSLSQALKYSFSGTFQCASFRKDAALEKNDELIILCLVDDMSANNDRIMILPPKIIGEIKFSDPKLPKYKGIKICYYARDNFDLDILRGWVDTFGINKEAISIL